jgi:hypothetical protein
VKVAKFQILQEEYVHVYLVLSIRLLRRLGGQRTHYSARRLRNSGLAAEFAAWQFQTIPSRQIGSLMLTDGRAAKIVVSRRHAAEGPLCALEACQNGSKWARMPCCITKAAPMTASAMEVSTIIRYLPARIL